MASAYVAPVARRVAVQRFDAAYSTGVPPCVDGDDIAAAVTAAGVLPEAARLIAAYARELPRVTTLCGDGSPTGAPPAPHHRFGVLSEIAQSLYVVAPDSPLTATTAATAAAVATAAAPPPKSVGSDDEADAAALAAAARRAAEPPGIPAGSYVIALDALGVWLVSARTGRAYAIEQAQRWYALAYNSARDAAAVTLFGAGNPGDVGRYEPSGGAGGDAAAPPRPAHVRVQPPTEDDDPRGSQAALFCGRGFRYALDRTLAMSRAVFTRTTCWSPDGQHLFHVPTSPMGVWVSRAEWPSPLPLFTCAINPVIGQPPGSDADGDTNGGANGGAEGDVKEEEEPHKAFAKRVSPTVDGQCPPLALLDAQASHMLRDTRQTPGAVFDERAALDKSMAAAVAANPVAFGPIGAAMAAASRAPSGDGVCALAFDAAGTTLYVAARCCVRRLDLRTGWLSTLYVRVPLPTGLQAKQERCGADGVYDPERWFCDPAGLVCTPSGHVLVSCVRTRRVYAIDPNTPSPTALATDEWHSLLKRICDAFPELAGPPFPVTAVAHDAVPLAGSGRQSFQRFVERQALADDAARPSSGLTDAERTALASTLVPRPVMSAAEWAAHRAAPWMAPSAAPCGPATDLPDEDVPCGPPPTLAQGVEAVAAAPLPAPTFSAATAAVTGADVKVVDATPKRVADPVVSAGSGDGSPLDADAIDERGGFARGSEFGYSEIDAAPDDGRSRFPSVRSPGKMREPDDPPPNDWLDNPLALVRDAARDGSALDTAEFVAPRSLLLLPAQRALCIADVGAERLRVLPLSARYFVSPITAGAKAKVNVAPK